MGFKSDLFTSIIDEMGTEMSRSLNAPKVSTGYSSTEITVLRAASEIFEKHGKYGIATEIKRMLSEASVCSGSSTRREGPRSTYDTMMDLNRMLRNDSHFEDLGSFYRVKSLDYTWYVKVSNDIVRIEKSEFDLCRSTIREGGFYRFNGEAITESKENTRWMSTSELKSFKTLQDYIYQILREI